MASWVSRSPHTWTISALPSLSFKALFKAIYPVLQHSPSLGLTLLPSQTPLCYRKGDRVGAGLPRASCSVGGLDFVQERFHDMSPGDFESTCIKAEDRTRKGLRWKEQQESLGGAALALYRGYGKEVSSLESQKRGLWRQVRGVSLG